MKADGPPNREVRWLWYHNAYQSYWKALAAEAQEAIQGEDLAFEKLGDVDEEWRSRIEAALPESRVVTPEPVNDFETSYGSSLLSSGCGRVDPRGVGEGGWDGRVVDEAVRCGLIGGCEHDRALGATRVRTPVMHITRRVQA